MAGFLYYIPGRSSAGFKVENAIEAGLGYAFSTLDKDRVSARDVNGGPDGSNGIVFAHSSTPLERVLYRKDEQTWRRVPKTDVWVGFTTAAPPTPVELVRPAPLSGHVLRLGSGEDWTIPVARGMSEMDGTLTAYLALPQTQALDDEGEWSGTEVTPRYRQLWDIACRWWDAIAASWNQGGDGESQTRLFEFDRPNDAAVTVLGTNYRIGGAEASMLGLIDDHSVYRILGALVDLPTLEAFLGKVGEVDGSSTARGPSGAPEGIAQPSLT